MSIYFRKSVSVDTGSLRERKFKLADETLAGRRTFIVRAITSDQRRTWMRNCDKFGVTATAVGCNCEATGTKAHGVDCPSGRGNEVYDTDTGEYIGQRSPAVIIYSCQGLAEMMDGLARTPYVEKVVCGEIAIPRGGRPQDYQIISSKGQERVMSYIPSPHERKPAKPKKAQPMRGVLMVEAQQPYLYDTIDYTNKAETAKANKVSASQDDSRKGMQADMEAKPSLSTVQPAKKIIFVNGLPVVASV